MKRIQLPISLIIIGFLSISLFGKGNLENYRYLLDEQNKKSPIKNIQKSPSMEEQFEGKIGMVMDIEELDLKEGAKILRLMQKMQSDKDYLKSFQSERTVEESVFPSLEKLMKKDLN